MTPQEFHDRILTEKGDMSWAAFAREFDDLSDKQLQYLLNARRKMGLPPISTLIAIDVLFTSRKIPNNSAKHQIPDTRAQTKATGIKNVLAS